MKCIDIWKVYRKYFKMNYYLIVLNNIQNRWSHYKLITIFCCYKKIKWVHLLLEHTHYTYAYMCAYHFTPINCVFVRSVFKKNVYMIIIHVLKYHTVVLFLHDSDLFYLTDSCSNKYMCKTTHATVEKSFYYIHLLPSISWDWCFLVNPKMNFFSQGAIHSNKFLPSNFYKSNWFEGQK